MMRRSILLMSLISMFLLAGCASIAEHQCRANAAYAKGVNDGKNNADMTTDYASICSYIGMPAAAQDKLNAEYVKGYEYGLENSKERNVNINYGKNPAKPY